MTTKQANQTLADYERWQQVIKPSLGDAGNTLLLGLALGGGYRGLQGLQGLFNRPSGNVNSPSYVEAPEEEEEKRAELEDYPVVGPMMQAFKGEGLSKPQNWPMYPALQAGAAGLGVYGGWRGADWLMDKMRKKQLQDELDRAKEEYRQALSGRTKAAEQIDELYDCMEKRSVSPDTMGQLGGWSLLAALLSGAGAGAGTYNLLRKQDPQKIVSKAQRQRQRDILSRSPQPLLVNYPVGATEEDEMQDIALDKTP